MNDEVFSGLDEAEVLAVNSLLNSEGGRTFVQWLVGEEEATIRLMRNEASAKLLRRAQGRLSMIQQIIDLFNGVEEHVRSKEPANG